MGKSDVARRYPDSMADAHLPGVSVIMPVRNEALFIERSLGAVMGQDYPAELIEILVIDGQSEDRTRGLIAKLAERDARICLLDNPDQDQGSALNIGIRAARNEFI